MQRTILAAIVMATLPGSVFANQVVTGVVATSTGYSSTARTPREAFSGVRTPAQEKGAHLGDQTTVKVTGTVTTSTGFSSTARTLREAYSGTGDKTITGTPALPSFSGTRDTVQVAPRASFTGNQSVPTPVTVSAPDQMKGKSIAPQVAPNQMKGKSIAPQLTVQTDKPRTNATINVAAGSLDPKTKVTVTDPASGKVNTVAAGTLNPSVQVAKPVQSAFVRPGSSHSDKSPSQASVEHGTGSGADNEHASAFGEHGAGGGFHM